jgi:hypothetical protein
MQARTQNPSLHAGAAKRIYVVEHSQNDMGCELWLSSQQQLESWLARRGLGQLYCTSMSSSGLEMPAHLRGVIRAVTHFGELEHGQVYAMKFSWR